MGNKTAKIDDPFLLRDRSFVKENEEEPEKSAFKSIKNTILNNIVIISSQLILTTNLILLGHTLYQNKIHFELVMIYQIGIFILELFGKIFILYLLKYSFKENEENSIYRIYIRIKTLLIFLIPIIILPVSLLSNYIMKFILHFNLDIYEHNLIREVWIKYLIYTPVIYLFEILFILNLQLLSYQKMIESVYLYLILFIISHITICWILLYLVKIGLIGLTISYCVNSFIFYFFSNKRIKKLVNYDVQDFIFFIIPHKENFDGKIINLFKNKSLQSLINYDDIVIFHLFFLASLFLNKHQLIVNIIYINFYELIYALFKGFYYNLKNYILKSMNDIKIKRKYVIFFALYFALIILAIFLTLVLIKYLLLDIYLSNGGETLLKSVCNQLKILFPLVILIMGIRMNVNGIIRGMTVALHPIKKYFYISIYAAMCYSLCFYLNYEIVGLWISLLILDLFLLLESIFKAFELFTNFFGNILHSNNNLD